MKLPLKESVMFLIWKLSKNTSSPHPCNNLAVSLRGVSYGRYHKPVTWKLPDSGIFRGRVLYFPLTGLHSSWSAFHAEVCWELTLQLMKFLKDNVLSGLGEGLSSPSLRLEILALMYVWGSQAKILLPSVRACPE